MTIVGIIGLGFMGRTHLGAYRRIPGVHVGAIASRSDSAAEAARAVGAKHYRTPDALLADPEIEAVSITLPTDLHTDVALSAIAAGKHVLIEKPLALTADECRLIEERAAESDVVVAVGHVLRHWPEYASIVGLIASGELGRPVTAYAERLSSPPGWGAWLADPARSGGAVHDLHIHDLDLLNWLFGDPHVVFSTGARGAGGGWDSVNSSVRFGSGPGAVWAVASASSLLPVGYPFSTRLRVVCERGAVEYSQVFDGAQVDADSGSSIRVFRDGQSAESLMVDQAEDPYFLELQSFVSAVRGEDAPTLLSEASLAVRTAAAARESLDTGSLVAVR